jgi:hypothetical protein
VSLSVVTFRAALLAALQARPGLADVQVEGGWVGPETEAEGIYLADITTVPVVGPSGTFAPANLTTGRVRLHDTSRVPFTCTSWLAGETPADAAVAIDRGVALLAEVVDTVQADPQMSGSVDWADGIEYRTVITPHQTGWAAQVVGAISLVSRLI